MKVAGEILTAKACILANKVNEIQKLTETISELKNQRRVVISSSSVEDCDDDYQEQLELSWELRDLNSKLANIKVNANKIISWFKHVGYYEGLKAWIEKFKPECLDYIISAHK